MNCPIHCYKLYYGLFTLAIKHKILILHVLGLDTKKPGVILI